MGSRNDRGIIFDLKARAREMIATAGEVEEVEIDLR